MTYRAPIQDMLLALNHGAGLKAAVETGHYGDFDPELAAAVLEEAGKFAAEVTFPLNMTGDAVQIEYSAGETLRVKDLAGCELVELDPRNFMSLLEQQSAFSIALMRVSSGGTEKRPQGSVGAEDKTEGGEKRATSAAAVA